VVIFRNPTCRGVFRRMRWPGAARRGSWARCPGGGTRRDRGRWQRWTPHRHAVPAAHGRRMLWPRNALGSTKRVGMDGAAWPNACDKLRRGRRPRMRQAAPVRAQAQQFSALRARKNSGGAALGGTREIRRGAWRRAAACRHGAPKRRDFSGFWTTDSSLAGMRFQLRNSRSQSWRAWPGQDSITEGP